MVAIVLLLVAAAQEPRLVWKAAPTVRQGDVLRVAVSGGDLTGAKLKAPWKPEAPFYAQSAAGFVALLPVPVTQKPGRYDLTAADAHGGTIRQFEVQVTDAHFPRQDIQVTPSMGSLKPSDDEGKAVHALLAAESPEHFWSEPFLKPSRGCMNGRFGVMRFHNGVYSHYHGGLDLRAAPGAPVKASAAGVVRIARQFPYRGGTVGIDHGQGVVTMYLHQSKVLAKEGERVREGQVIGAVGGTGFATGPHLHWSVYVHGVSVNPMQWARGVAGCGTGTGKGHPK